MNPDPQEFETLRKLMALKRHEQPPPEYLSGLSNTIISRIERGDCRLTMWERISTNVSARPGLAYALGLSICGTMGLSAVYVARHDMAQPGVSVAVAKLPMSESAFVSQLKPPGPTLHVANWLGNTNPNAGTQPEISLFNTTQTVMPVSYSRGN